MKEPEKIIKCEEHLLEAKAKIVHTLVFPRCSHRPYLHFPKWASTQTTQSYRHMYEIQKEHSVSKAAFDTSIICYLLNRPEASTRFKRNKTAIATATENQTLHIQR